MITMIHGGGQPNQSSTWDQENHVLLQTEGVIYTFVIPIICVFGILCNMLNLVILTRQHMKESPYTYLLGLAVADLSVLSLSFVQSVLSKQFGGHGYGWKFYEAYIYYPLANFLATASVWITVFLTIERFISVRYPLHAKDICTKELARKIVTSILVLAFVVNIPRFFCLSVQISAEGYKVARTPFVETPLNTGVTWFYIITINIMPLLTLMILNTCLLVILSRAHRQRACLSHHNKHDIKWEREQRRLTVTCISIIFLFIICILPSAFSHDSLAVLLFRTKNMKNISQLPVYRLLRAVTNMLVFCNLSLNFVLYCVFNNKFATTCKYLINFWMWKMLGSQRPDSPFRRLSSITSSDKSLSRLWSLAFVDRRKSSESDSCVSSDIHRIYRCPASAEQSLRRISDLQRQTICEEEDLFCSESMSKRHYANHRRLSKLPSESSSECSGIFIGKIHGSII